MPFSYSHSGRRGKTFPPQLHHSRAFLLSPCRFPQFTQNFAAALLSLSFLTQLWSRLVGRKICEMYTDRKVEYRFFLPSDRQNFLQFFCCRHYQINFYFFLCNILSLFYFWRYLLDFANL